MDRQEIEEILFETAAGIETPELCEGFLELVREGDPGCADRLRGLLAVNSRAQSFFRKAEGDRTMMATQAGEELVETLGAPDLPPASGHEKPGEHIGRYRLEERIGEGGCGVVYLAEQTEPVKRQVALKIIRLGMDSERVVERFEMERQSLALMDHPNIARVLDGGATETGRPYFVMEWVRGARITEYCDSKRFSVRQRIDLFIDVCKGIQHAHQKGVIHRDIKPSNVLVSDEDGRPVPKVIDFGIAKAITNTRRAHTEVTSIDHLIGTPAYMSPEQADRKERDIDTRCDVYSLGILLYELMVGRTPIDSAELAEAGVTELQSILIERERPSALVALRSSSPELIDQTALNRNTSAEKLFAVLRGDLNSIIQKAIERDRTRRYETVNGFILDLQRYTANEPVLARPPSRAYLLRKFVQRNRLGVGAAAGILLSLILGLGTAFTYYLREKVAREEQIHLRQIAEKAHASELKRYAEARGWEEFAHISLLLSEGKTQEADELLRRTPLSSIQLSSRSSSLLRSLGNWNALRGRRGASARGGMRVTPEQMMAAKGDAFVIRAKSNPAVRLWCLRVREARGLSRRGRNRVRLWAGPAEVLTGNRKGRQQAARDLLDRLVTGRPDNYPRFANPDYDRLVAAGDWTAAEGVLLRELPLIPLYFNTKTFLLRPRVRGWRERRQQ
jgi:serine/threonine protein kinase